LAPDLEDLVPRLVVLDIEVESSVEGAVEAVAVVAAEVEAEAISFSSSPFLSR
jgi:hypothetical protein